MLEDTTNLVPETPEAAPPAADPAPPVDVADDTALGGKVEEVVEAPVADAPVIPEAYELAAPEGTTLDPDIVAEATPIFKELGLTNDAANKLMPVAGKFAAKIVEGVENNLIAAQAAQRKSWLDDAKAAEDIGGAKWDATLHTASKGLDALGYKEGTDFRKLLNETGLGNHPDVIRIAAKLGEMVSEDGEFVRADAGAKVDVPLEKRLYPND